jgi:hypothetical protein
MASLNELQQQNGQGAWVWRQPPSPLTQVCVVTDDTTPRAVSDTLLARFGDASQFALLHLDAPDRLRADWVSSCAASARAGRRPHRQADELLASLPASCRLLLCTQSVRSLDWLGSVCGHRCRFAALHATTTDARQTEVAIEAVHLMLHEAVAERWGDAL